jgi:microcin C transport system substrate-binding protein
MNMRLTQCLMAIVFSLVASFAGAAEFRHGLSVFGDLKYPPGFKHFDYVDPQAPKGGRIRTTGVLALQTFDSFNAFIAKGDPAENTALLLFDSLMERAQDEPDAVYGLVAEGAMLADDRRAVTFKLRPQARFHDGTPVTAADVAFSIDILRTDGDPVYQLGLKDVKPAVVLDPLTVRFEFTGSNVRDLPSIIGTLPIFSKAWWQGRKFDQPSLDVPLGSGPYKVGKFDQRSSVTYARRADYWAKDLAVNVGRFNFDEIKLDYYADRDIALQALLAGDLDFGEEFTSRNWAKSYNVPQVTSGRMIKEEVPDGQPAGTQGWFFNLRRDKFTDPRVREAIGLAFDFEWTNKNLFFGAYRRTTSFFQNTPHSAPDVPSPGELALLEPFRQDLPASVFETAVRPPVSDGTGQDRVLLRKARKLLADAGWTIQAGKLTDAKGQVFTLEFLLDGPSFERILGPYIANLKQLGIEASIRTVDIPQYQRRQKSFDFDVISTRFNMAPTPGTELRSFFSSAAADLEASNNHAGIKNKVVDALLEMLILAKTRAEMTTTAQALDRVLLSQHYWVPEWNGGTHRLAYWNRFSRPAIKPPYDRAVLDTWWYDAAKDATTK